MDSSTSESDSVPGTPLSSPIDRSPRDRSESVSVLPKTTITPPVFDPPSREDTTTITKSREETTTITKSREDTTTITKSREDTTTITKRREDTGTITKSREETGTIPITTIREDTTATPTTTIREDTTATPITPKSKPKRISKMPPSTASGAPPSTNAPHTAPPQSTTLPDRFATDSPSRDDLGPSPNPRLSAPAASASSHPPPFRAESSTAKLARSGPPRGPAYRGGHADRTALPGNSRTWTSTEARVQRAWFKLEPHLSRMFPADKPKQSRCPYVPRNLQEYTMHLSEMETLKANRSRRILDRKEEMETVKRRLEETHQTQDKTDIRNHETLLPTTREAFDGSSKTWGGDQQTDKAMNACNRSAVLGLETIWCDRPHVAWRESADWPTMSEMKWEGVQRVATENGKFRRFPALPRVPHAPEVPWHTVPLTKWHGLDDPWPVPNEEDVFAPTEDIAEEKIPDLLNSDIVEALDIGYSL